MGYIHLKKSRNSNLFKVIAPVYKLFYNRQKRHYSEVLENMQDKLNFSEYKNIIDIGCGTGALCSELYQKGLSVTGIEPVKGMLSIARKKHVDKEIEFIQANVLENLPFEDKSFDISIASYVAHGLQPHERKIMYSEMGRITKYLIIIYDYNSDRSLLTNIIEWFERGDYFNFIEKAKFEMEEQFSDIRVMDVDFQGAWYIFEPNS